MGKIIVAVGIAIVVIGAALWLIEGLWGRTAGSLPGDIHLKRDHFSLYIPITTCVLLSVLLTIILTLLFRRR